MEKTLDRKSPDALTALKTGDVLLIGGQRLQVVRAERGWIRHQAWVTFTGEGAPTLVDVGHVGAVFASARVGDPFTYETNGRTGVYLGEVQYREAHVKAVPVALAASPKRQDIVDLTLVLFRSGDRGAMSTALEYEWRHDAEKVGIEPSSTQLQPLAGVTKWEALAYVVSEHGPMTRTEALKAAQRVLGLPYVPGSNTSYFNEHDNVLTRGLLVVAGKRGNSLLYGLGPAGAAAAGRVSALVKAQE